MHIPSPGQELVIDLPGERLRAVVARVMDADTVIMELIGQPLTRNHNYRKGQMIAVRREHDVLGERWAVLDELPRAVPMPLAEMPVEAIPPAPQVAPPPLAPAKAKPKKLKVAKKAPAKLKKAPARRAKA